MEQALSFVTRIGSVVFFAIMDACAQMEPDQSVWVLAAMGAAISVFYSGPRNMLGALIQWNAGIFFAVLWVVIVDRVQPQAEALAVGMSSSYAVRVFMLRFGTMAGGLLAGVGKTAP